MTLKIATAPVSWGVWFANDPRQTPWNRFLDEVAEAGYAHIELGPYGYLPTDPQVLRCELDKRGLTIVAGFAMADLEDPSGWPRLEAQATATGELLATLGARFLVLIDDTYTDLFTGAMRLPRTLDPSAWQRLIDKTHTIADLVHKRFELEVVFHPHVETHVEYEDQIEAFLEQTDPARISLCLDTGHHAYRGGDPVQFLRRHRDRLRYLHLKNVDGQKRDHARQEHIAFAPAVEMGVFCEPSQGVVDFAALRDVLHEIGFNGWPIVEHDMYPTSFDRPLPIAKRTRAYLARIGIGE
jgi:inosose dehydratase